MSKTEADLVAKLLAGVEVKSVADLDSVILQLKKAFAEKALNAELDHHLAEPGEAGNGNHRNGFSKKTLISEAGRVEIAVPRDRASSFEPQLIAKYKRRFPGFDDKIISMYARGMTVREIQGHIAELYGLEASPDLISTVTDAVLADMEAWRTKPLESIYPLVFLDALVIKVRSDKVVQNKSVYVGIGVRPNGTKEILGLWIEQTEGAKFWLSVMNELKERGVTDILIAVVDGLKGFPEAIETVFPKALVQTCIVHLIRNSLSFVSYKDRKAIAGALKGIYRAVDADAALSALEAFEAGPWGARHPAIAKLWRRQWPQIIPFFAFSQAVRRIVYTTNAIEALNAKLRKAVRTRGHFPTDDAAKKLLFLVLRQTERDWKMPPKEWGEAKGQFAIMFEQRFPHAA